MLQVADEKLPAQAAVGLTAEPATMTASPQFEVHAPAARTDDQQGPPAGDHQTTGSTVRTAKREAGEVGPPLVADEKLPAPATGVLLADEATNMDMPVEASASQADELQDLLAAGRQALAEHRLLMPPNDSAYHYFQGALRLAPGNPQATQGIEQIVQRYIMLSTRMLKEQNDLMARRFISRGLRIQPDNAALLALREKSVAPPAPEPVVSGLVTPEPVSASPDETVVDDKRFISRVKGFLYEQGRAETASVPDDQMTSSFLYE